MLWDFFSLHFFFFFVSFGTELLCVVMLLECFPPAVQNRILWKETERRAYKYGCLPWGQASQPVPHWPHHLVASPCNFREEAATKNQRENQKGLKCHLDNLWSVFFLLFSNRYFVRSGRDEPCGTYTAKALNKTWSDKSQTYRNYWKGQKDSPP